MKILFTGRDIQLKVEDLAEKIESPDVMLCVLNGAFMFFYDLVKKMDFPVEIDFLAMKTYYSNGQKLPAIEIIGNGPLKGTSLTGRSIVVVEDIVDTGSTLIEIAATLQQHKPKSITIVSLLKRKDYDERVQICGIDDPDSPFFKAKFLYGFEVEENDWLVGYGLDDNGKHRTLPYIFKKS